MSASKPPQRNPASKPLNDIDANTDSAMMSGTSAPDSGRASKCSTATMKNSTSVMALIAATLRFSPSDWIAFAIAPWIALLLMSFFINLDTAALVISLTIAPTISAMKNLASIVFNPSEKDASISNEGNA